MAFSQLKELNELFEQAGSERAQPERLVRSEILKRQAADYVPEAAPAISDATGSQQSVAAVEEVVDAFDLADPVAVLDKMPKDFYDQLVCSRPLSFNF